MKYLGGKQMLGKHLAKFIKDSCADIEVEGYLEPFCGSLGVLTHMTDTYECIGSDYHPDLIAMWESVQRGEFIPPTEVTEADYLEIKQSDSPSALKGFVGFGLSFGGRFFGGYAQKYANGKKEDFLKEAVHSIERKQPLIKDVDFYHMSYTDWDPVGMLIYCDPPYKSGKFPIKYRRDVKKYDVFDNDEFWNIMREWSKTNIVFISEISAPKDFISVWDKESHRSISQSGKTRYKSTSNSFKTERLFIHKDSKDLIHT
jgi:DNA adenine methylase